MLPMTRNRSIPFDTLVDLSREMDRLVSAPWTERANGTHQMMPTEVIENDEEIRFEVEVPGIRVEDIDISLENGILAITADKKLERDEHTKESDYRVFERRYGKFQRMFAVPAGVRGDRCEARYENGVLTVRLPKAEEAKPRRIRVEVAGPTRSIDEGTAQ